MTKSAQGDGYAGLERIYSVEESNDISTNSWKAVPGYQNVVGNGKSAYPKPLTTSKNTIDLRLISRKNLEWLQVSVPHYYWLPSAMVEFRGN